MAAPKKQPKAKQGIQNQAPEKFKVPDLYPLIVLYNQPDPPIWQIAAHIGQNRVRPALVCDNSTDPAIRAANQAKTETLGWTYISMNGNKGVAQAYRKGTEALVKLGKLRHFVVLFDQDTHIPQDYFERLQVSIAAHTEAQVHLPLVYDKKGLMSPCSASGHAIKRCQPDDALKGLVASMTGINSGMAIQIQVFTDIRHSKDYFLDYVDHAFMRAFRHWGGQVAAFEARLEQQFSDDETGPPEPALQRFNIYCGDFWRYCQDTPAGRAYYRYKIITRAVKLYWRYKHKGFPQTARRWIRGRK